MKLVKKKTRNKTKLFQSYFRWMQFLFSEPETDTLPAETSDNSTEESKLRKYFVSSENINNAHGYAF